MEGTVCLAYTVAANFDRGCEPEHKVLKKCWRFGVSSLHFSACMNQAFRLDLCVKAALFPLLSHGLAVEAVEEMESK